ncbi:monoheme cytochrome C [Joostella sp. CR20]|uniref:monoheme cytochrome C n=1 Tax=Joostella sp. CR20 TaxID=2804312 RepID=UPI00313CED70
MQNNHFLKEIKKLINSLVFFVISIIGISFFILLVLFYPEAFIFQNNSEEKITEQEFPTSETKVEGIKNGIHTETGFVEGKGLNAVIENCTNCHSAKLVTQNRMTREGWLSTIRWMQQTQNLWDLGKDEATILDYLSTNYAPTDSGRRPNLEVQEWYELN